MDSSSEDVPNIKPNWRTALERLNASSVWRSVLGLWKRSIWVRLVNQVKAYLIKPPYLIVRAPALLFLRWSKFLIFHKIIGGEYTRLTFTKNLSDYFGSLNKGGKPERDRHFFFFPCCQDFPRMTVNCFLTGCIKCCWTGSCHHWEQYFQQLELA